MMIYIGKGEIEILKLEVLQNNLNAVFNSAPRSSSLTWLLVLFFPQISGHRLILMPPCLLELQFTLQIHNV